jgi:hypothetical protein
VGVHALREPGWVSLRARARHGSRGRALCRPTVARQPECLLQHAALSAQRRPFARRALAERETVAPRRHEQLGRRTRPAHRAAFARDRRCRGCRASCRCGAPARPPRRRAAALEQCSPRLLRTDSELVERRRSRRRNTPVNEFKEESCFDGSALFSPF